MDLATQLATLCVRVKTAADLPVLRDQFEGLSNEEESLRSYADRLKSLADSRAAREDQSLGGYVATGANRLLPVPHTGTEAAVRLPMIGAAGVAGSVLGRHLQNGPTAGKIKGLLQATRGEMQGLYRGGGALAGLAAGSAITGIPLAVRALLQKRQGGEAAVRARGRMNDANQQADAKANAREDILSQINSSKAASDTGKSRLQKLWERRDPEGIERKKKEI